MIDVIEKLRLLLNLTLPFTHNLFKKGTRVIRTYIIIFLFCCLETFNEDIKIDL